MDFLGFVLALSVVWAWLSPDKAGSWLGAIARAFGQARALPDDTPAQSKEG